MISANSKDWFKTLFFHYQKNYLLPRHFHSICIKGDVDVSSEHPTLYIANHSSWWDGLLLFQLTQTYSNRGHYVMMEEQQLRSFRFFSKLGAFSIYKNRPKEVMTSLNYAVDLLKHNQSVWVFPQGSIEPLEKRPLKFQSGLRYLIKHVPDIVIKPVTFYYAFDSEQKPTASAWFGDPIQEEWEGFTKTTSTLFLEKRLENQLNAHHQIVATDSNYKVNAFRPTVKTGTSTSDRFLRFKRRTRA